MIRQLVTGEELEIKEDPYSTCSHCPVRDRCGRRSGTHPLPSDYLVNPDCSGYLMVDKAMKLSQIPPEFIAATRFNYTFDADNMRFEKFLTRYFERPKKFVEEGKNLVFMHPLKGTGKTKTACTIANEYIFNAAMTDFDFENPLALYVKYGTWANDIRQMYQVNDEDYNIKILRTMRKLKEVPLLILDDIGSGRITPIIRDLTYDLIDYRKEHQKATIYTTNLTKSALNHPECLGDIITSRMLFRATVCQMAGRDRREDETYYL